MAKDKVELKVHIGDYVYLPIEKLVRTRYNFKKESFEQMTIAARGTYQDDWHPIETTTYMHNFVVEYLINYINKKFGAKK